jgi:tetratricopeptide (TPR) repeat protein
MRSRRWRHVLGTATVGALVATVVFAQPSPPDADDALPPPPRRPTADPAPAVVATSVPDWAPGPPKLAVTPFENHVTNGKSLEWIVAEAPFEIAEKAENVLALEAALPPLHVPGERVPPEADTVHAFAHKTGARFVVTGWFDRLGDNLRIAVLVWRADASTAKVVGEAQRLGPMGQYHKTLGEAAAEAFAEAGVAVDAARTESLTRALSGDIYPVFMMGRGLGHFTGALAAMHEVFGTPTKDKAKAKKAAGSAEPVGPDLDSAKHDLERAVFLDPKLFQAQRLLGELYMTTAAGDPKLVHKATGKFNYAADLAPDDIPSLRAAAFALARAGKHEVALDMFKRLVTRRPWDLEARYQLGAALWHSGDAPAAERQLEQVTTRLPDHLQARRVLVLIHASRSDTPRLIRELEAIEARLPLDLEIKADLATAYGTLGEWPKAINALEMIAAHRPNDLGLLVRIGDAHRKHGSLDTALGWYQRASRVAPDSSLPGYAAAQAQFDAGRFADATRTYQLLLKFAADKAAAEHALGVIALVQGKGDEAAWYLRQATRNAPRVLASRRALVAAELSRKDAAAALAQLEPALAAWPQDGTLRYLAGLAHAFGGDASAARDQFVLALRHAPAMPAATAAIATLNSGGSPALDFKPELVRPWGDGAALQHALEQFELAAAAQATTRKLYQDQVLGLLGLLGQGPRSQVKQGSVKTCPIARVAPLYSAGQQALQQYTRLGVDLEAAYRFIARHDDVGLTASLLPNSRTAVKGARKRFRTALADIGELRAEWTRGVTPELRAAGCTDRLIAAAIADPQRYRVIADDKPEAIPPRQPPRAKPRTTFFVDNTRCADPVEVWIDGSQIGQVAPGRRSALVTDGGERTLCLLVPGGPRCGDRGTLRQIYLHDGWSTTMHCTK